MVSWQQDYIDAYKAWNGTADVRIEKSGTWYWIVVNGHRSATAYRKVGILDATERLIARRKRVREDLKAKGITL